MKEWLFGLEREYEINILFACEAGSRSWGLASDDSDYDVRFIYHYKDNRKYLSLRKSKDVFEFQSPFDASGFDLFKAFGLVFKSNPSIYEWAFSPIIYLDKNHYSQQLKNFILANYSPFSLYQHYGSLVRRNRNECVKGDYTHKKQKQLIQAIRAELLRLEIKRTKTIKSPFEYIEDSNLYHSEIFSAYNALTVAKRKRVLLPVTEANEILHLIDSSINEKGEECLFPNIQPPIEELDRWIWKILK